MTTLREVLTVRLAFPTFNERLACEPEAPNLVRLTEFSTILPLAPGDLIEVNDKGEATTLVEQAPGYICQVFFHQGTDQDVIIATAELWGRATQVHIPFGIALIVTVQTESKMWVDEVLETNPLVEFVDTLREPDAGLDLAQLIADET